MTIYYVYIREKQGNKASRDIQVFVNFIYKKILKLNT